MDTHKQEGSGKSLFRGFLFLLFLYLFLVSIELLGCSMKLMGSGFAEQLLRTTSNPFIGLFIGILATSIIQSSSATTSIVVGMVGCGTLCLRNAIPMVMGANIGTTVTNTLVSLVHVTRPTEFRRAISGAIVHDYFNLLSVLLLLPIELGTHYLEYSAVFMQKIFSGIGGFSLFSPLRLVVKPAVTLFIDLLQSAFPGTTIPAILALFAAIILLFVTLSRLVILMKQVIIGRIERLLHNYLFAKPLRSFALGMVFTAIIQSSSAVTSLAVPLVASGILTVEQIFPYTVGSNIGTTITALMASLVTQSPAAIATAFVHLLFNISGSMIWYPLRKLPISLAKHMGKIVSKRRWFAVVYILLAFYIIPLIFALAFKGV